MEQQLEAVSFNNLNIHAIEINSGIFIGQNQQNFWGSHSKNNNGMGSVVGRNIIYKPFNLVVDHDLIDHQFEVSNNEIQLSHNS